MDKKGKKLMFSSNLLNDSDLKSLPPFSGSDSSSSLENFGLSPRELLLKAFKNKEKEIVKMNNSVTKEPSWMQRLKSRELIKRNYVFAPLSQNVNLVKSVEIVPIRLSSLISPEYLSKNKDVDTVKICDIVITWQPKIPFNSSCKTYVCFADFCLNKLSECYQVGSCFFTSRTCGEMIFHPAYPVSLNDNYFDRRFNLVVFTEGLDTADGTIYATMPTFVKSVFYNESAIIHKGIRSSILNMLKEPNKKLKLVTSDVNEFLTVEEEKMLSDDELDPRFLNRSLPALHISDDRNQILQGLIKMKKDFKSVTEPARMSFHGESSHSRAKLANEAVDPVKIIHDAIAESEEIKQLKTDEDIFGIPKIDLSRCKSSKH